MQVDSGQALRFLKDRTDSRQERDSQRSRPLNSRLA
jgi:hypothetical protein